MTTLSDLKRDIKNIESLINSNDLDQLILSKTSDLNELSKELLLMGKELLDVNDNPNISSDKKLKLNNRYRLLNKGLHAALDIRNELVNLLPKYKLEKINSINFQSELIDAMIELEKEKEKQKF